VRRPWAPPLPEVCHVQDVGQYAPLVHDRAPAHDQAPIHGPRPTHGPGAAQERAAAQDCSPASVRDRDAAGFPLPWALLDLPEEQRLGPRWFTGGSLLVSGGPGSGRSTALGTIVEAALRGGTPVHLIAEDAERWPGAEAPAAGTWCPIADPRRLRRLLQRLLDGDGPGLLVLDDVDAIAESLEETGPLGEGADLLLTVLRRARRLGLDVALSAAESARRWAMAADRQLLLCPRDPADAVLAGAPRELVAAGWPPGRGVLLERGDAWVAQVLLCQPERESWLHPELAPLRLAPLPTLVRLSDAPRQAGETTAPSTATDPRSSTDPRTTPA